MPTSRARNLRAAAEAIAVQMVDERDGALEVAPGSASKPSGDPAGARRPRKNARKR